MFIIWAAIADEVDTLGGGTNCLRPHIDDDEDAFASASLSALALSFCILFLSFSSTARFLPFS